jgi:hypothetical protein
VGNVPRISLDRKPLLEASNDNTVSVIDGSTRTAFAAGSSPGGICE